MFDWFLFIIKVLGIYSLLLVQVIVIGLQIEDINFFKLFQFYFLVNDVGIFCCILFVFIMQLILWIYDQ